MVKGDNRGSKNWRPTHTQVTPWWRWGAGGSGGAAWERFINVWVVRTETARLKKKEIGGDKVCKTGKPLWNRARAPLTRSLMWVHTCGDIKSYIHLTRATRLGPIPPNPLSPSRSQRAPLLGLYPHALMTWQPFHRHHFSSTWRICRVSVTPKSQLLNEVSKGKLLRYPLGRIGHGEVGRGFWEECLKGWCKIWKYKIWGIKYMLISFWGDWIFSLPRNSFLFCFWLFLSLN